MKRFSFLLFALFFLLSLKSVGQSTINLPNGNFENWSTGSGYNVSAFILTVPVYNSYVYPTGWKYPSYPVNQTVNYQDMMDININTNIPLLRVSNETMGAPYGSHAVRLQSFMLSDIVTQTAYDYAAPSLDPRLTSSTFPTVLSTAEVNVEKLIPLMSSFIDNTDSMPPLLSIFSDMDLDSLFTGGIRLNGLVPGQLTGYYKYTSGDGNDNGGILLVGSKYNPDSHRRELVGYGYSTALTDTANYVPFSIAYTPLSEIDSTKPYLEADSLVVLLFSSANSSPQRGSALYLDRLQLWTAGSTVIEDTCSAVSHLTATRVTARQATFTWAYEGDPIRFEAEYGLQGFALGEGRTATSNGNNITLSNLTPDTDYDVYIRSACGAQLWGEWSMLSFRTDTIPTIGIEDNTYATDYVKIYPNPAQGRCVVQFEQEMPSVMRLYAMDGALVMETVPDKETMQLTLPSRGIFILACETKKGVVMQKIINLGW